VYKLDVAPFTASRRRRGLSWWMAGVMVVGLAGAVAPPRSAGAAHADTGSAIDHRTFARAPVVYSDPDNDSVSVFFRGPSDEIYAWRQNADGSRSGWQDTGATFVPDGDPVVARGPNRPELFVRDSDGRIWRKRGGSSWTAGEWLEMDAPQDPDDPPDELPLVGNPVVVAHDNSAQNARAGNTVTANTDRRLEVFARGGGDEHLIWHSTQVGQQGNAWTGWEPLPPLRKYATGDPAVVVDPEGLIAVVTRVTDGTLWYIRQTDRRSADDSTGEWNGRWRQLTTVKFRNVGIDVELGPDGLLRVFGIRQGGDSDGQLWMISQTDDRTAKAPADTWAEPARVGAGTPRPSAASAPVVVAGPDGRFSAFVINAADNLLWQTAQSGAGTAKQPDGEWDEWTAVSALDDNHAPRSVDAIGVATGNFGRLELFTAGHKDDQNSLYHRAQLVPGHPANPLGVWLAEEEVEPVGRKVCEAPGTLDCVNIMSADLNTQLDFVEDDLGGDIWNYFTAFLGPVKFARAIVQRIATGRARLYVTQQQSNDVSRRKWTIVPSKANDGTFRIRSRAPGYGGLCVEKMTETFPLIAHLELVGCDPNSEAQKWYFEPVTEHAEGGIEPRIPQRYRIRQADSGSQCVVALKESRWPSHSSEKPERMDCPAGDSNDFDEWIIGVDGQLAYGVFHLALTYAGNKCTAATCRFVDDSNQPATYMSGGCVSPYMVHNREAREVKFKVSYQELAQAQLSVGGSVTAGVAPLTAEFLATHSWMRGEAKTHELEMTVPPGQYGWVVLQYPKREAIGYWSVDMGDANRWQVRGRVDAFANPVKGRSVLFDGQTGDRLPALDPCPLKVPGTPLPG
jgi:hypothetical protein